MGRALTWWRRGVYRLAHLMVMALMMPPWRMRGWGLHNVPARGPVLFVGNHESLLDPIVFGYVMHWRAFRPLARRTLWRPGLGWALDAVNAVPLERGEADTAAVKRCIEALKAGSSVLIYPEGTRTRDGEVQPFKSGLMLIVRRARPTVVPTAIEGAFDAWPRSRLIPNFNPVGLAFGRPIPPDALLAQPAQQAAHHLRRQVVELKQTLRHRLDRYSGKSG